MYKNLKNEGVSVKMGQKGFKHLNNKEIFI